MSEGITIALITAIGSLLGGIVGQIITASATIKAAKIKEKTSSFQNTSQNNSWKRIVLGAIIGAVATLIVLFSLGMMSTKPQTPVEQDSPTATTTNKTPTPTAIVISDTSVLFDEDFEDKKAQKVTFVADGWQIIADETGNFVYDVDNSKGADFPSISFGSSGWKDYKINLRIRFLGEKDAWGIISFRTNDVDSSAYVVSIIPTHTGLSYNPKGSGWVGITNHEYSFSRNTWHWVRIEAKGAEIKVFVDDDLIINTDDTRYTAGFVNLGPGQYTHMQIDDIQVISLEE